MLMKNLMAWGILALAVLSCEGEAVGAVSGSAQAASAIQPHRGGGDEEEFSADDSGGHAFPDNDAFPWDDEGIPWKTLGALRQAAESGDPKAQHLLALAYFEGAGLQQDAVAAAEWFRKAAEQGSADAQNYLGHLYQNGLGVEEDDEEAVRWYRQSAELGNIYAQYNIGWCYESGEGVGQDYAEALKWYELAAGKGVDDAMVAIGRMYQDGRGVEQDYSEALKWYQRAAEAGNAIGRNQLGSLYLNAQGVTQDYAEAMRWFREAAKQDLPEAINSIGYMYDHGLGVSRNQIEAMRLYRKSAELGSNVAMYNVAFNYDHGEGVRQDSEEAAKWYEAAAEKGNVDAMLAIGTAYRDGRGVDQDYDEAMQWYRKAAEQGQLAAMETICEMINDGRLVDFDCREIMKWARIARDEGSAAGARAVDILLGQGCGGDDAAEAEAPADAVSAVDTPPLFDPDNFTPFVEQVRSGTVAELQEAADNGDPEARYALGLHCLDRESLDRSARKAAALFREAADAGHVAAKFKLAECYLNEDGVFLDYDMVFKLAAEAAAEGYPPAIKLLGDCYWHCWGIEMGAPPEVREKQLLKSMELYNEAALKGYAPAVAELARIYNFENMPTIERDPERSLRLHRFAAEHGALASQRILSMYYSPTFPGERMVPPDENEALKWQRKMAEQGDLVAMYNVALAETNARKQQEEDELTKGFQTFLRRAHASDPEAQIKVGDCYRFGYGVGADLGQALEWYFNAAENGVPEAEMKAGEVFESLYIPGGTNVSEFFNIPKAIEWYRRAHESGYLPATVELARLYAAEPDKKGLSGPMMRKAAEAGNPKAQILLSHMYLRGEDVDKRNGTLANVWFRRALRSGYATYGEASFISPVSQIPHYRMMARVGDDAAKSDAMVSLGLLHYVGVDFDQDEEIASRWYRKAVELGHAGAQHVLGNMLLRGDGIPRDVEEGMSLLRKAAEQGGASPQYDLATALQNGVLGERDFDDAEKWMILAAEQDHPEATLALGNMYADECGVKADYPRAKELFNKAFQQFNLPGGAVGLGKMNLYAKGMQYANLREAERYFFAATRLGDREGLLFYANTLMARDPYSTGDGPAALELLTKAATAGEPLAQYLLGMRAAGQNDYAKSAEWMMKAAEQEDVQAMGFLGGILYADGLGVEKDVEKAVFWLRKASEAGELSSQQILIGYLLAGMDGAEINVAEGLKFCRDAARQGYLNAMYILVSIYGDEANQYHDKEQAEYWTRKIQEAEAE